MRFLKAIIRGHINRYPLRDIFHKHATTNSSISENIHEHDESSASEASFSSVDNNLDTEWLPSDCEGSHSETKLLSTEEKDDLDCEPRTLPKRNRLFGRSGPLFKKNTDWVKAFLRAGLFKFLRSSAGGDNSKQLATITCNRLSSYINWVITFHIKCDDKSIMINDPLWAVMELLVKEPQYIGKYMDFLTSQNASPSTKLTVLCQLKKCALWSTLFSPKNTSYNQNCFDIVCRNVSRACAKQNRIRIQDRGNLDNLIKCKRWPKGGYVELRELVLQDCKFMDELSASVNNGNILKKSDYCKLLRILLSLMYLTSHQGRPNAFKKLT